jgi:DNA-binding MarR family transcriptional regulator
VPRRPATPRPAPTPRGARGARHGALDPLAEPLHRGALRLLRLLRREDRASGVSAARLSALSVLVFGGPSTLGALADAEQVSAPTMTRLVQELERGGWVRREADPADARSARIEATPAATRLLRRARARRLGALTRALRTLAPGDRSALAAAVPPLLEVVHALATRHEVASAAARARPGRRRFD